MRKAQLTRNTKDAMKVRDKLKQSLRNLTGIERQVKLQQFKKQRNRVIGLIRQDEKEYFSKLINNAGNNCWNPINKLLKQRSDNQIPLKEGA